MCKQSFQSIIILSDLSTKTFICPDQGRVRWYWEMRKIESFGNVEIGEKRRKLDLRGYSIVTRKSKPETDSSF